MIRAHPVPADDYAALSDRMGYLLVLRVAMAVITVAGSLIRPESVGAGLPAIVGAAIAYAAIAGGGELVRRRGDRIGFAVLNALLLVDGVYLAWAMYVTGATGSPLRFLVYLHLVAVSLLASYRTGLKIALWHSLLLFVVLYAQAARLLPAVDVTPGRGIDLDSMPVLNVTSFWLFAIATSIFSAMNERELRQRRADLQALVDVGASLDQVSDPGLQACVVLDGLAERFGFRRGVILGAAEGRVVVLAARGVDGAATETNAIDAIVRRAWERRGLLAVKRIDATANPMLTALMPNARNLLIAPLLADGDEVGAIVVEHASRTVFGVERRVAAVLGQFAAVAALNLRNAVLLRHVQSLAQRDSLTGAANRHTFRETLERTLNERDPGERVTAVLFIDLDDFKVVNDSLGHSAGDALLVAVTDRIRGLVRDGDLVARLGGDEFAVLTDDDEQLTRSRAMAQRLVRDLRRPYTVGRHSVTVTASIGIASDREANGDALEVVRNADVAMYMAKANGKAGYALFDPGMHASIRARHELGAALQQAVDLGQLRLVYQPIVALDSGQVVGVEALVRWQHPERGLVAPGEFIEIAEENGTILPIGRWVLHEACARASAWQTHGTTPPDLFVCVNVSAREIAEPGFVEAVEEALARAGLTADRLVLELTETALIRATGPTVETLDALRRLGVRVGIDDFGTGYFSLSHLRQFPVDALKVAGEFVQVAHDDPRSAALAGAIVALGRSLSIATVAEGIETEAQARRMRELGATYGQGFFFSAPLDEDEVAAGIERLTALGRSEPAAAQRSTRARRFGTAAA